MQNETIKSERNSSVENCDKKRKQLFGNTEHNEASSANSTLSFRFSFFSFHVFLLPMIPVRKRMWSECHTQTHTSLSLMWTRERGDIALLSIVKSFVDMKNRKTENAHEIVASNWFNATNSPPPTLFFFLVKYNRRCCTRVRPFKNLERKVFVNAEKFSFQWRAFVLCVFVCPFEVQSVRFEGCLRCLRLDGIRLWRLLQTSFHRRRNFSSTHFFLFRPLSSHSIN